MRVPLASEFVHSREKVQLDTSVDCPLSSSCVVRVLLLSSAG